MADQGLLFPFKFLKMKKSQEGIKTGQEQACSGTAGQNFMFNLRLSGLAEGVVREIFDPGWYSVT